MTQRITQLTLGFFDKRPVVIDSDTPDVSSDGGFLLLREVDGTLGVSSSFAAAISDPRAPSRVIHDLQEQCRQRMYGIAPGYEDCNDADRFRHDPVVKTTCDRLTTYRGCRLSRR